MIRLILAAVFIGIGVLAAGVGVLGLFRFSHVLNRMHAAAIVDTLAVLGVVLGLLLLFGLSVVSVKLLLILIFLWLTSPVASHLIAKMELLTGLELDADEKTGEKERLL
mgnify:CR=1 FL=1